MPSEVDTGRITHDPQMHRHVQWKAPVRVATTANGTFASAFDAGSTIDGETLVEFDRILIKNQTDQTDNGIYEVQASGAPLRAYDMDSANEVPAAVVIVMEGTANAGKLFYCTNIAAPAFGDDDITFDELTGGGSSFTLTVQDEGTPLATGATTLNFTGSGVTASGTGATKTINVPGSTGLTVQDEGTPLATDATTLNFVGSGVTATGTGATKTITVPGGISGITVQDEGTPLSTDATTLNFVGDGVTATGSGATKTVTIPAAGTVAICVIFGDGGSVLNTGVAGDLSIPFGCTITAWRLLADVDGAVAIATWKDSYSAYPPTGADLIVTPEIVATNKKAEATGLSHSIVAGDTLRFNINSVTDIKRVTLTFTATRT